MTPYKQIYPAQCPILAKLGFQTLINLRFDDECDNQPKSVDIADSARTANLTYHHFPVNGEQMNAATVTAFCELLNNSPKPVMVFCNSGNRAKRLYQNAKILGLV